MRRRNLTWGLGLGLALAGAMVLWRSQGDAPATVHGPDGAGAGVVAAGSAGPLAGPLAGGAGQPGAARPGPGTGAGLGAAAPADPALAGSPGSATGPQPVAADQGAPGTPGAPGQGPAPSEADALLARLDALTGDHGTQPPPVDLRRDHRRPPPPPTPTKPVRAADTGLPAYPGAMPIAEQSLRDGPMVSMTATAFASFKAVRTFYGEQLRPGADGQRQVTVLADTSDAFDVRIIDVQARTVQRVQLAAVDSSVVIQLSRVDVP